MLSREPTTVSDDIHILFRERLRVRLGVGLVHESKQYFPRISVKFNLDIIFVLDLWECHTLK